MYEPIEVMAYHHKDGSIVPLRFKMNDKEYRCGDLLSVKENNYAGNPMLVFKLKKGTKVYDLHLEKKTGKWYLAPPNK